MVPYAVQDFLGPILGAGGVAFLGACFKGIQMLRDGAQARERKAIAGLERYRHQADQRAEQALADADYQRRLVAWNQARVGMRDYVLLANGLEVPADPPPPVPPPPPVEDEEP